jgi:hypothetical protein
MTESKAKEVAEILDALGDRFPRLITTLRDAMFSEEAGRSFGKAVGAFYQELLASGVSSEDAVNMAQQYLMTIQAAMRQGMGPGPMAHGPWMHPHRHGPRPPRGECCEAPEPPQDEPGDG